MTRITDFNEYRVIFMATRDANGLIIDTFLSIARVDNYITQRG